jgi:hypothetical protein
MSQRFEEEFIPSVRHWCQEHADKVTKCYASMHQGYPSVFVIGRVSKRNRDALGQPLAVLGMNLRQRGWDCNMMHIPCEDSEHYDAFLEAERAVLVYAEGR